MSDVLRIDDLSAGYGPLGVLHSVDLTVRAGERVGIVGLNGHGKSTLSGHCRPYGLAERLDQAERGRDRRHAQPGTGPLHA